MAQKKNKQNLEQYLDGGNLDLSVMAIQDIPVSRIAAISKVTSLDLSNNEIVSLPNAFASSLTRLVKLDLSRNQITNLPDNFGLLVNLKYLDLYSNKLESFPLSFGNLKSLRWLDVKQNPLMPKLAEIAGFCQDNRQCEDAAKNIVATLRTMQDLVNAEIARRKEEQLKQQEKSEGDAKTQSKENQPKKKKKKKASNTAENTNPNLTNGKTHSVNYEEDNNAEEESSKSKSHVPTEKMVQQSGLLRKVGGVLSTLLKFVVMSTLLVLFCGFLLSLFDEDLYTSLQKKGSVLLRSNIPRQYLKHWDNGLLVSKRAMASWLENAVTFSVLWFNRLQDYWVALSSNEVVQQYLESIQSGWHILWIYLCDFYTTVTSELAKYFSAPSKTESDSLSGRS